MIHIALRKIRLFHQLKQKELANKLGISRSHLSEIESGRKGFSLELLQKYAQVFQIPLSSIVAFNEWLENGEKPILSSRIKAMISFVSK